MVSWLHFTCSKFCVSCEHYSLETYFAMCTNKMLIKPKNFDIRMHSCLQMMTFLLFACGVLMSLAISSITLRKTFWTLLGFEPYLRCRRSFDVCVRFYKVIFHNLILQLVSQSLIVYYDLIKNVCLNLNTSLGNGCWPLQPHIRMFPRFLLFIMTSAIIR